ncbi:MAG TPA: VWA domain-containing protein [Pyrinomonadaceae bacterium]|nr:VWA domain-containing protein [Pyrinomonadaceae bacterium]HMP65093.1 VWA domain-containing protein [Pyrinomonadaceae bacterium]
MKNYFARTVLFLIILILAGAAGPELIFGQARPQRPTPTGNEKRNQRPTPKTEEELRKEAEERERLELEKKALVEDDVVAVETNIVNIDAVVYNRRTGQVITGLTKENFAVFENGVRKQISSFSTPETPITVTLVLEYSKWSEVFGRASGQIFEPGIYETVRPVAYFLSRFIKPPNDYASVIAFDMRPTPITDFTNDPNRIRQTIDLLLRSSPAFRENNLFDAIKLALIGGRADSIVLENTEERYMEYQGMVDVRSRRRAIILVASGIDTFSRTNYGEIRRVVQESGIPIYIISTGNLFYKKYEPWLGATDSISGVPGRLTFLQAKNQMNTFARESGGAHFEMTFPSEIPGYLQSIDGLLRSQYALAYDLDERHAPGKRYKLEVKVDVNGDGNFDDRQFIVQHRPFLSIPKEDRKK